MMKDQDRKTQSYSKNFTSEDELKIIWNNTNDAIFLIAPDGAIFKTNPGFEKMLGYNQNELKNFPIPPIIPPHTFGNHQPFLNKMKSGEVLLYNEAKRITKQGQMIDVVASYRPIIEGEELLFIVGMYKDVTKQMEAQRLLSESEEKYRFIAENTTDLILVSDEHDVINYASPSIVALLDYTPEDYVSKHISELVYTDDIMLFFSMIRNLEETAQVELRFKRKNGGLCWMEVKSKIVLDHLGTRTVTVARDISERKKYEEELKYLAYHDPLTGLLNRRIFTERLNEEMEKAKNNKREIAILYLDIDNFKTINDTKGHDVGDFLLIEFAKLIKACIRDSDLICRLGGDEFVILATPNCNHEIVTSIAERIKHALEEPFSIHDEEIFLTSSIGIFVYEQQDISSRDMIIHADHALYAAKSNGKNQYYYWTPPIKKRSRK